MPALLGMPRSVSLWSEAELFQVLVRSASRMLQATVLKIATQHAEKHCDIPPC